MNEWISPWRSGAVVWLSIMALMCRASSGILVRCCVHQTNVWQLYQSSEPKTIGHFCFKASPRAKPFIWKCLYSHVNELTLALWIKLIFKWKDLQLETEEKGLLNIKWPACVLRAKVHKAEPMFYFVRSIYRKTSCVDYPGAFLTRNRKNAPPKTLKYCTYDVIKTKSHRV